MASSKRIINVGASARASDVQKISDVAAAADDRALEILYTPGATLKGIVPLDDTVAIAGTLVAGKDTDATLANGKVRVRPAWFRAGSNAYTMALSAKLAANSDSPTIGNNSSGATRTDLLYATISYGTATTETVRQKPTSGSTPVSVSLTTQKDMKVTISVVAGVASGDPTASLPADDTVNGVYNFALAALSIADGYAGGAINQSSITQLWSRAKIHGSLTVNASVGGTSTPTPTIARGDLYREQVAWAACLYDGSGSGTFKSGFNIQSVTRTGVGDYTINFSNAALSVDRMCILTGLGAVAASNGIGILISTVTTSSVRILCHDTSSAPADCILHLTVFHL